jgi:cytochrome c553
MLLCAFTFIGCSDKEEKKEANTSSAQEGKIEVVQNDNFKEEKVHAKAKENNVSKDFYYDYNQDKKVMSEEVEQHTPIEAALKVKSPYEHVEISMLVSKLSKTFILKCSACHDDYANGIIGPSLLSKDSAYIYGTIVKYKSGEKKNVLMKELVMQMNDKEIKALADEIYTFNQQIKKLREK